MKSCAHIESPRTLARYPGMSKHRSKHGCQDPGAVPKAASVRMCIYLALDVSDHDLAIPSIPINHKHMARMNHGPGDGIFATNLQPPK